MTNITAESGTHDTRMVPYADLQAGERVLLSDGGVYVVNEIQQSDDGVFVNVTGDGGEHDGMEYNVPVDETSELALITDGIADQDTSLTADQAEMTDQEGPAGDPGSNGVDLAQCTYTTDKGRRCKLAPNHDGAHRMVIRDKVAAPKSLAELRKLDAKKFGSLSLVAESIPRGEDVSREYNRDIPRDDDQKRVDADAKKTYDKWVKGGNTKGTFEDLAPKFGARYIFPPEAFDTVVLMLRRAVQSGGPVAGKKLAYRRKNHESGNAMVYFTITDQDAITKPKKPEATASKK
jgi:hypothetical protein